MCRFTSCSVLAVLVVVSARYGKAEFLTADVAVYYPGGQYAPLEVDELVSDWNRYYWYDLPVFAEEQDFHFWQYQHTGYPTWVDGIATFEVVTNGPVLMAVTTRWGGGGDSGGDWEEELTTRDQLEAQGWVEFATGLHDAELGGPAPYIEYIVFRRDSVAGETFTYRTEKYRPPTIILRIPEPTTVTLAALGLLVVLGWGWRRRP